MVARPVESGMSSAAGFDSDTCRALCRDGRAPIPKFTRVRAAGWPCSLKQDSNIMHANSYMIPAPRGLIRVNADGGIAAEVAAEIRNFKANFAAWQQKHGDRVGTLEDKPTEAAANSLDLAARLAGGEHARLTGRGSEGIGTSAVLAQHTVKNCGGDRER